MSQREIELAKQVEMMVRVIHDLLSLTRDDTAGTVYLRASYIRHRDDVHAKAAAALSYNPKF